MNNEFEIVSVRAEILDSAEPYDRSRSNTGKWSGRQGGGTLRGIHRVNSKRWN